MKNYILLLLLATLGMQAQTYQNPTYGTVKLKNNTQSTTAAKVNVQESDGAINWQFIKDFQNNKPYFSTGLLKNGLLTINADNTKFDLSAGIGVYSDFSDPENVTSKVFNFPAFSAVVSPYIATSNITYVAINYNGGSPVLVMQASQFSNAQIRDLVVVGAVVHSNFTTINVINNISSPSNDVGNSVADLFNFLGARNQEGNVYSANGANLQLNKSAGVVLKYGANFHVNSKNPHNVSLPEQLSLTFRYRLQGGFEGTDRINVDVDNYDLNNVLTAVPNNKYTIQTIFIPQTGQTRIQYGQAVYNTLGEAIAAINTRKFNVETNLATQFVKVAYLVLKKGTTSLQSVADADIIQASKFDATASGGVAITYQSIIDALTFTPENAANKATSFGTVNNTLYPTVQAVVDYAGVPVWSVGTYTLGKIVKHKINDQYYLFQSNLAANTSTPKLTKGVQPFKPYIYGGSYVGVWSAGSYVAGNIVSRNSYLYYCLTNNSTDPQLLTPPDWLKIGVDEGVFNASFAGGYKLGDAVRDVSNNVYTSQINFNTFPLAAVSDNSWDLVNGQPFNIASWGDSLTFGTGSDGNYNYTNNLQRLSGLNVWNGGVAGETSTQIKTRFLADKSKWSLPTIFWVGRNNYTDGVTVKADIAEMVSKLGHENYLVVGIIKATSDSAEPINTLNNDLKVIYKDRFVDMQPYLLSIYNPAIPQDVIDHGNGVIAWSMRSDWLHLNNLGYSYVAKLINSKINYLLGGDKISISNLNTSSIQISGNDQGLQPVKAIEVFYDDITDKGVIEAYDRVNSVVKPLSIQYPLGSELRLVEQGGTIKIGDLPNYTSGSMYQLGLTVGGVGSVQRLPSGNIGKLSKWVASGVQGDSFFTETSNQISLPAGVGFSVGGNTFAIPPSPTEGVFNIVGSSAQYLTFSTQSYIYNSSSLFRLLSSSDIDFVVGGSQRFHISSITGKSAFTSTVTASPATVDTELATLGQAKAEKASILSEDNTFTGSQTFNDTVSFNNLALLKSYTVATLPTGLIQGAIAYVTDGLSPTYRGTATGGGSEKCLVFYDGTVWRF